MNKKTSSLLSSLFILVVFSSVAQESNGGKKLYAKSILNQKAPELIVQEWLTKVPNTRGKFVLVDFSATWCHACRKAMPEHNLLQKKFADKLVVIFITKETPEKVLAAKNFLVEVATAVDTLGRTSKMLEVKGIPHLILIDPKGYVRWEGFPASKDFELTEEVVSTMFEKYGASGHKASEKANVKKVLSEPVLNGVVRSISESDFIAIKKPGEIQTQNKQSTKVSLFNAKGGLLEESFYKAGDTLVSKSTFDYDARGNLLNRNCFSPDGSLYTKSAFKYDSKGNVVEEIIYNVGGKMDCKSNYKYDGNANLVEEFLFDSKGAIEYKSVYRYDPNDRLVEKNIYNGNGGLSSRYVAKYDIKGNKVEDNVYGSDGSLINKYSQSYDANNHLVKEMVYTSDGVASSVYTYSYDSENNKTQEKVNYPDGNLVISYVYKYDNKRNEVETYRFDPDGALYLQSYTNNDDKADQVVWDYYNNNLLDARFVNRYEKKDKMGNWLQRVKILNKRPAGFTVREIQYHDQLANTNNTTRNIENK